MAEQQKPVVIEDPRAIRALAHPARMEAIDRLYAGEVLTATELADGLDVTPSAMSYHLRELSKWGIIIRVSDDGDGRERRWQAAGDTLTVRPTPDGRTSPTRASAGMMLISQELERVRAKMEEYLLHLDELPPPWNQLIVMSADELMLSPAEFRELHAELRTLIERFERKHRVDPPPDARHVRFTVAAIPMLDARPKRSA